MPNDINNEILSYRVGICRVFIVTLAIIAVPALFASLYRITSIGWQPVMAVHIIVALILWSIALSGNRVPYPIQAGSIVLMFLAIGLGGLWQFGLIAGGVVFLVLSSPIATLFFGGQVGLAVLFFVLALSAITGYLVFSGTMVHDFDIARYAVSGTSWMTSIAGWALAGTALTLALHVFNGKLIASLQQAKKKQNELNARQLELEEMIKEKEKALSEIKILQGIIPICAYCHSIRSDEGAWSQLENYISTHSDATFSHGICPNCVTKVREDFKNDKE